MNSPPGNRENRSDEALIAALNGGDLSAFDDLYFRYRDWILRLAYRFTGNPEDALDVVQETFTYLFRKFPGFVLTARLTTFLYPVVKNLSLAARRKRVKHLGEHPVLDSPAPPSSDPDQSRKELQDALGALSESHREILLMRFVDDMTIPEIAETLGVPEGTVKSRLHHAVASLRGDPKIKRYFGL